MVEARHGKVLTVLCSRRSERRGRRIPALFVEDEKEAERLERNQRLLSSPQVILHT